MNGTILFQVMMVINPYYFTITKGNRLIACNQSASEEGKKNVNKTRCCSIGRCSPNCVQCCRFIRNGSTFPLDISMQSVRHNNGYNGIFLEWCSPLDRRKLSHIKFMFSHIDRLNGELNCPFLFKWNVELKQFHMMR